jgi:sugar phosphate isomerase/epimerase
VASYGSYWRAGIDDVSSGRRLVEAAGVLGAPRIRVWAGSTGSGRATRAEREGVVRATSALARVAIDLGVTVAFEFHADTLADSPDSVLDLLDRIDSPAVRTYWQPPNGTPDAVALQALELVLDGVDAVHVFSWWPHTERRPLLDREELWRGVVRRLAGCQRPVDLLMEFVADDRPDVLVSDATALRSLLERSAA